jgi:hypothetical protein
MMKTWADYLDTLRAGGQRGRIQGCVMVHDAALSSRRDVLGWRGTGRP